MWDSLLLAYADGSRVVPAEHARHVTRRNGDVLPSVLVDGRVVGVWRATPEGIEVTAFQRLDDDAWAGVEDEARGLLAFVGDRDPEVYGRYGHWWAKGLPAETVRTFS